jgi:hypothetical protein
MPFDPNTDKIAITVPSFTFKKGAANLLFEDITDLLYSEPYLVTIAIDSQGIKQEALNFNFAEYVNIRRGGTVEMIGDGHLIYGPDNPGEFVDVSVLLMESSREDIQLGKKLEAIINSKAIDLTIKLADIAAEPTTKIILNLMRELSKLVSEGLQKSEDRYLFRTEGVFFRDRPVPYAVNRQYTTGNELADITIKVIPLDEPNGQGPVPGTISLKSAA